MKTTKNKTTAFQIELEVLDESNEYGSSFDSKQLRENPKPIESSCLDDSEIQEMVGNTNTPKMVEYLRLPTNISARETGQNPEGRMSQYIDLTSEEDS